MDLLLQLGAYGFVVRTCVEIVHGIWHPHNERVSKTMVVMVSALLVWVFGADPVSLIDIRGVENDLVRFVMNVSLIAPAAMGTHDILDLIARKM